MFDKYKDFLNAFVAQWIEHPPPKWRIARSIRVQGTLHYPTEKFHPT